MTAKWITVKTESGQVIRLPLSQNHQADPVFLAALRDIWRNKIWIPVNIKLHQLFQYDWLAEPVSMDD